MTEHVLLYDQVYSFYDMMLFAYINTLIFGINEQYLHSMSWYTGTCGRTAMAYYYYKLILWSNVSFMNDEGLGSNG
jgi:hypothetical protein